MTVLSVKVPVQHEFSKYSSCEWCSFLLEESTCVKNSDTQIVWVSVLAHVCYKAPHHRRRNAHFGRIHP